MNLFMFSPISSCLLTMATCMAAFIEQPVAFNTTQGSIVTFHCEINMTGNILFWLTDSEVTNSDGPTITTDTTDNRVSTTLTLEANRNTDIQCVFRPYSSRSVDCNNPTVTCSDKAKLLVQGLLSSPSELNGQSFPNVSAITLSWKAPPSLDLTGVDPNILYYEILVFDNVTGEMENFTSFTTDFTYYISRGEQSVDTCQELDFSVLAVNSVGRGNRSDISVSLYTAPSVKLTNHSTSAQTATNEQLRIECMASCNSLIAWRLHTPLIIPQNGHWYNTVSKEKSGNECVETISLKPVWPKSVNTVSVQCVAVSLCSSEAPTSCVQSVCLSHVQNVSVSFKNTHLQTTDKNNMKNGVFNGNIIYLICVSVLCLVFFCFVVVIVGILAGKAIKKRSGRNVNTISRDPREERIYESLADIQRSPEHCNKRVEYELCDKEPGSLYSLPTDPCPAYGTLTTKNTAK